jgi:uncharacterized protein YqeY
MRERIAKAVKDAMRSGDKRRLGTLRLILAAIKDRDLGVGGPAPADGKISDSEILGLLQKMIKQRRDSITAYRQGGRKDLVDQEAAEVAVIEEFLPQQMGEAETKEVVAKLIEEIGAQGQKDMGRVMAALKQRYAGQMDFAKASGIVTRLLR